MSATRKPADPLGPNPYVQDILAQPGALLDLLDHPQESILEGVAAAARGSARIVLTGMGSSFNGAYPAWLSLVGAGLPAWWVEGAELVPHATHLLAPPSLLWVVSQSGRSAEVEALLARVRGSGATVFGTTNDPSSPLGRRSELVMELRCGEENTVSTRSYVNTLAATRLAALRMLGGGRDAGHLQELRQTAAALGEYLADWRARVAELESIVGAPERLMLVGRGPSLASARTGALIIKEAAKWPAEGMSSSEFRHGPLELADGRLSVVVFAGRDERQAGLNRRLATDLKRLGAHAIWASADPAPPGVSHLVLPSVPPSGQQIAEIVPIQLLSVALARAGGFEPGAFRHSGKVTTTE